MGIRSLPDDIEKRRKLAESFNAYPFHISGDPPRFNAWFTAAFELDWSERGNWDELTVAFVRQQLDFIQNTPKFVSGGVLDIMGKKWTGIELPDLSWAELQVEWNCRRTQLVSQYTSERTVMYAKMTAQEGQALMDYIASQLPSDDDPDEPHAVEIKSQPKKAKRRVFAAGINTSAESAVAYFAADGFIRYNTLPFSAIYAQQTVTVKATPAKPKRQPVKLVAYQQHGTHEGDPVPCAECGQPIKAGQRYITDKQTSTTKHTDCRKLPVKPVKDEHTLYYHLRERINAAEADMELSKRTYTRAEYLGTVHIIEMTSTNPDHMRRLFAYGQAIGANVIGLKAMYELGDGRKRRLSSQEAA